MMLVTHDIPSAASDLPFQPLCGRLPFLGSPAPHFRARRRTAHLSLVSAVVVMRCTHEIPSHERHTP